MSKPNHISFSVFKGALSTRTLGSDILKNEKNEVLTLNPK